MGLIAFGALLFALSATFWMFGKVFGFNRKKNNEPKAKRFNHNSADGAPESSGSSRLITPNELELAKGSLDDWEPKYIDNVDLSDIHIGDFPVILVISKPIKCIRCSRLEIETIDWGHWGESNASPLDEYGNPERIVARGCMVVGIQTHWECAHCKQGYRRS